MLWYYLLVTRSTLLPLAVLVFPLVGLVCPLVVIICLLVVLVCPLVVLFCPLVVLVVLSVGLFITDPHITQCLKKQRELGNEIWTVNRT